MGYWRFLEKTLLMLIWHLLPPLALSPPQVVVEEEEEGEEVVAEMRLGKASSIDRIIQTRRFAKICCVLDVCVASMH